MTEHPIEHASHSAEQALTAHDQASLDIPATPIDEPWWPQARLTTLLRDLAHYADTHTLDFEAAVHEALAWHRTDLAEQIRYRPGDEVHIRNTPHQGIITALSSASDTLLYEVRIIGKPYRHLLKAADLASASAFPALTIESNRLLTAADAERVFQKHVERSLQTSTTEHAENCKLLAETLSTWSGVPRDELYLSAYRAISPRPADLAAQSYPATTVLAAPPPVSSPTPCTHPVTKGLTR